MTYQQTLATIALINADPNYAGEWSQWQLAEDKDVEGILDIWFHSPDGLNQISLFTKTFESDLKVEWIGRTSTHWFDNINWSGMGPCLNKTTNDHYVTTSLIFPDTHVDGAWVKAKAKKTGLPWLPLILLK
jgi:hypothetical protein